MTNVTRTMLALLLIVTSSPAMADQTVRPPKKEDLQTYVKGIKGKGKLTAVFHTTMGNITCVLFEKQAPMTVANFVGLARGQLGKGSGGGSIVNITSISGVRASTLRVAYGTSKAALVHLTKQMAVELGTQGIRVNAVSPGPVDTAMAKKVHTPDIRADYHDNIPLNRYGSEQELAEVIFFLSSDKASYINGTVVNVDGGFAASGIGLPSLRKTD